MLRQGLLLTSFLLCTCFRPFHPHTPGCHCRRWPLWSSGGTSHWHTLETRNALQCGFSNIPSGKYRNLHLRHSRTVDGHRRVGLDGCIDPIDDNGNSLGLCMPCTLGPDKHKRTSSCEGPGSPPLSVPPTTPGDWCKSRDTAESLLQCSLSYCRRSCYGFQDILSFEDTYCQLERFHPTYLNILMYGLRNHNFAGTRGNSNVGKLRCIVFLDD